MCRAFMLYMKLGAMLAELKTVPHSKYSMKDLRVLFKLQAPMAEAYRWPSSAG